jgi:hypothetical protein
MLPLRPQAQGGIVASPTEGRGDDRHHWDGIAAHCAVEKRVALGFVEGLNNNVRVIQRRAYGLRDEEYLRLTILTCMLSAL